MINSLELKFGSSPKQPNLKIEPTAVTVFVGPNNSGKSKIISEIFHACTVGTQNTTDVILKKMEFDSFDQTEAEKIIGSLEVEPPSGSSAHPGYIYVQHPNGARHTARSSIIQALCNPNSPTNINQFATNYMALKTLKLDGNNRINLVKDQPMGDLLKPINKSFHKLFTDDNLRNKFSRIIHKNLNEYAVIDPTYAGHLRLRLSQRQPAPEIERSLTVAAIDFHGAAQHIALASDGVKAFTGILAEIIAGDPKILLMDEPEAFLHPALAFNLGREIAESLSKTDKRMFVATHSPQFVMGCIQSGVPINVVRLTYRNRVASARLLPSDQIIQLMRKPLLRSTGVISALFYESVVITEADTDRAFYQEINERLLREGRGIPNCIFLNAQNKQTIPQILDPLRQLGIPAAAIYDIDFVKDGGNVATRFMETAGIPELTRQGLTQTRSCLANALRV